MKKFAALAAVPALALAASAFSFAPATTQPSTASITGVIYTQDQPNYTSPNNDFVSVHDSLHFSKKTTAIVQLIVDNKGVVEQVSKATYAAGTVKPVLPPVVESGGTSHNYTIKVVDSTGKQLARSAVTTSTATLFPPVSAPLTPLQQWQVSYGNAQNALITADITAVENATTASQAAAISKLTTDVQYIQAGDGVPGSGEGANGVGVGAYPPIAYGAPSFLLNYWSGALEDLSAIQANPSLANSYLNAASSNLTLSGVEW